MMKEQVTHDTSVVKLDSSRSPRGPMGEKYLASGVRLSMRLWEAEPVTSESEARLGESERDYEVVGYVVSGSAYLHIEGQTVRLESRLLVRRAARRAALLSRARALHGDRGDLSSGPGARPRCAALATNDRGPDTRGEALTHMGRGSRSLVTAAIALGALVVVFACRPPPGSTPRRSTTLTGAELGSSSNDDAIMRITTARCERELACNKIGQGRAYEDQPTCLERIGELMDEEAGKNACPSGVDPLAISTCLLEIQRTPCGGELEQSTNVPACTKSVLCLH